MPIFLTGYAMVPMRMKLLNWMNEVADLNLPSDLPTTSGQHTGNKLACATLRE